jgi:hypothetical protein
VPDGYHLSFISLYEPAVKTITADILSPAIYLLEPLVRGYLKSSIKIGKENKNNIIKIILK